MTRESRDLREHRARDRAPPQRDARAHTQPCAPMLILRTILTDICRPPVAPPLPPPDIMNDMTADVDNSRVLVVDDQADVARMLAAALERQGHQVRTVTDGQAGFAWFAEWRPALVLTDLRLPVMDGLELCRRIREQSRVPIIVVSGTGEEAAKVEALDAGADDYVTKPFGTGELLARVRAALRRTGDESAEVMPFEVGAFRVDLQTRRVHVRGHEVRLTPK